MGKSNTLGKKRYRLYLFYQGVCQYCGVHTIYLEKEPPKGPLLDRFATLDHIIPKCDGGTAHYNNLVLSCHKCNQTKGFKVIPKPNFKVYPSSRNHSNA